MKGPVLYQKLQYMKTGMCGPPTGKTGFQRVQIYNLEGFQNSYYLYSHKEFKESMLLVKERMFIS